MVDRNSTISVVPRRRTNRPEERVDLRLTFAIAVRAIATLFGLLATGAPLLAATQTASVNANATTARREIVCVRRRIRRKGMRCSSNR